MGDVIKMPVREVVKNITFTVKLTGMTRYRWRVAIGGFFISLGTAVMGIGLEVKND